MKPSGPAVWGIQKATLQSRPFLFHLPTSELSIPGGFDAGSFLGAMYFSFALGVLILAPIAALLWFLTGWWITKVTIWAVVLFLPFAPTITLFARVLWIYLDQTVDPEPLL